MKIENIEVYGFRRALHGMRNPQDSWADSDSKFHPDTDGGMASYDVDKILAVEQPIIGAKDLELACNLIKSGSDHRKFLRQIIVWMDITIPRYVWQELDTYKVATVRNSCSTMNKLGTRDLEQSDFEVPILELTLERINYLGRLLREAKVEHQGIREARRQLKGELSEGFLQKATYMLSYETALVAYMSREFHRLPEWRFEEEGSITRVFASLPYMNVFYQAATAKKRALREAKKMLQHMLDSSSMYAVSKHELQDLMDVLNKVG